MQEIKNIVDKNELPTIMKAIRQHEFGDPEVLRYEDAPVPEVKNWRSTCKSTFHWA